MKGEEVGGRRRKWEEGEGRDLKMVKILHIESIQ